MKIMGYLEVQQLLNQHRRANIKDYIQVDKSGEETVVIPEGKIYPIQRVVANHEGQIVELELSNGAIARNGDVVYLIRASNGAVKIGYTNDLNRRFRALNLSSPLDLEVLGCIKTAIAQTVEFQLHTLFSEFRIKGEWFRLTDKQIQFILSGAIWQDPPN